MQSETFYLKPKPMSFKGSDYVFMEKCINGPVNVKLINTLTP